MLGMALQTAAHAADIFYLEDAEGNVVYASQALDKRFRRLQGDDWRPAITPPASPTSRPRSSMDGTIERLAVQHGVDAKLVLAVVATESNFDANAISRKGAVGAMQLMPTTAARYGVTNRKDAVQNIDAGIRHLKYLLGLYQGNVPLALAAYNAGENAVLRHGQRIPPYRETMLYVPAVLAKWQSAAETPTQ